MVFIKQYSKNIWPYYTKPYEDELFTSWFCRLINLHQTKPIPFISNYLDRNSSFFNRDIDVLSPPELVSVINSHTPLDIDTINLMFLKSYEGFVLEKLNPKSYSTNILPIGILHRKRKLFGQMFCPGCLQKSSYYKKEWRLITSILCSKCKIYLQDRCPKCESAIAYHRINIGRDKREILDIYHCSECLFDLRKSDYKIVESQSAIEYQEYINNTIKNGYNNISSYSFQYINTLLHLSKKILSNSKKTIFRNNFTNFYNINFSPTKKQFRFLTPLERMDILIYMNKMLMDWPISFNEIRKLDNFNNSEIIDRIDKAPYWIAYHLRFKE